LLEGGKIVAEGSPAALLPDVRQLEACSVRPADGERLAAAIGRPQRLPTLHAARALAAPLVQPDRFAPRPLHAPGEALLSVSNLTHRYDGGHAALSSVSLAIHAEEFVALIGQNGSGKTTLARHLNGLLKPTAGAVRLRGQDLSGLPLNRVAKQVGYVFQNPDHQIFAATVRDEVAFGLRNFGYAAGEVAARSAAALEAVGLVGLEDADPFLLGKGQRERLAVASLLALRPRVLILDEPTTGLDYGEQRRMMELLRGLHAQGMTIVVITHSPWVVAEYAERGILMQKGRIVFDGALRALFAQPELLARCHFRIPDITRLGQAFGFTPLSLDEFLTAVPAAPDSLTS
jgi:energy-coupling factor transport system ATP-binding protein